jgi:hypothetical protein
MGRIDAVAIVKRIDALLAVPTEAAGFGHAAIMQAYNGALSLIRILYGPASPHEVSLLSAFKQTDKDTRAPWAAVHDRVWPAVEGVLASMKGEVEAGLVGNLERRGVGEALGDMVALAREALDRSTDDAHKNVAGVLAAAAYEDTIRKMGESLAGVVGRPDLQNVVGSLKTSDVLVGSGVSTAVGFLSFRNRALHAEWDKFDRATVSSCLSFVQEQLVKHFS